MTEAAGGVTSISRLADNPETDFVFEWIKKYKLERVSAILKKKITDFKFADETLKEMVKESKGPIYDGNDVVYSPLIIGGHYNNYNFQFHIHDGCDDPTHVNRQGQFPTSLYSTRWGAFSSYSSSEARLAK